MIDLGAHGMYLIEWLLGMPISARSAFTVSCELERVLEMNTDRVEDNAVTVMSFESGAIAVNETGFVSKNAPMILEVRGEEGYVVMENDSVVKCTAATENRRVAVELGESLPSPMEQFLSGNILSGCSIKEGRALTRMMEMAYN
jgi:predicted dehydrogenase